MPATGDKTISINIRAITGELTSGLKKATTETKAWGAQTETTIAQVEQATERMSHLWRSLLEAFIGIEAVKGLLGIARSADEAREALASAALTAANFGHAFNPEAMEKWLRSFANSAQGGGYSIDEMRDSVQQFASVGMSAANIQRALADTASLAAAKNISFAESATIVRYAYTGHIEMLTRYGIISREAAKGIKTVEEAFDAIEHATKGAAAERSERLAGSFGRLATAASLFRDKVGDALIPIFDAIAKGLIALADALTSIPQPILDAVVGFMAFAAGAIAVTLLLPAMWKGLQILWDAFNLLLLPARAIASFLIGPLIAAFGEVITWLGGLTTAFASGTVAEWAFVAPVPAIVLAAAALVGAIALVVSNLGTFEKAWSRSLDVMATSFRAWVATVGQGFKQLGMGIVEISGADSIGELNKGIKDFDKGLDKAMNTNWDPSKFHFGEAFKKDFSENLKWAEGAAKASFGKILGFLNIKIPNIGIPGTPFPGDIPGKGGGSKAGKDASGAAAENALKNFEESLKNWLATFQSRVDDAKAHLDRKSEQLADFDVVHPANQPMSAQDQATRQGLVNQQLQAEQALRERLLQQQQAEKQAANEYLQVAAAISTHLKNHDQLIRQARDGAREHAKAAQDVYLAYLRAGTELDSMIAKERAAANLRIDDARDSANDSAEMALSGRNLNRDISGENDSRQLAIDKSAGRNVKPASEDRVKLALDELAVAAAADTEAMKQQELARARQAYDATKSQDDLKALAAAQNALLESTLSVTRAEDQRAADQAKLFADLNQQWTSFINGLVQKANVPGLQGSAQAGFSFDPLALLMDALEKTQSFADVMNTVTQIVNTFAQALDAFRPVIDGLLDIIRAVANVFIFMYNAVARILDLFGMQIQQLQYLTSAMSGLVPLLEIWHEIPTLNELAAGRLNSPLSTTPTGSDSLGQSNGGQNTLMRIVEVLVGIMAAIIVEKVISGMSLTQAVQQTVHLLGINMGQKVASAQAVADAARSVGVTISTAAKQAALGIQANVFLAQANVTLTAILAALEVKNVLSIFSDAAGVPAGAAGASAGVAGAAGVAGGAAGPAGIGNALKGLSDGVKAAASSLMSHSAALRQNSAAFANLTALMGQFGTSVAAAASYLRELQSETGMANLNTALSLQTQRVAAVSGYGLDRVPGM